MTHESVYCKKMIDFDSAYKHESSKLEEAILENNISKAMQLMRIGADINFRDDENRTPLMAAVEASNPEMCEYLIKHGAELEIRDSHKKTAYLHAAKFSKNSKVLEVLEESGCNIYARDENNDTALFLAALYNDSVEIIKHLLKRGFCSDDSADIYHYTPIMAAAHYNLNPEVIKILLKSSENIDLEDKGGDTALMHSAFHDKDDPRIFLTVYSYLKKNDPKKLKERLLKKDKEGNDAYDIAFNCGNSTVAAAIKKVVKEYAE